MANSFQLIRTNPRISGNFKITVDSQGRVWFNTIDANKELADNKYKKFRVGGGSYEADLRRFMSTIPPNVLFDTKISSNALTTPKKLVDQYEFFYSSGASLLESAFYDEPYSYFAPMWLEDDIPNYFVIVKVDDPLDYPYNMPIGTNDVISGKTYKVTSKNSGSISYNTQTYTDGQTFVGTVISNFNVLSGDVDVILLDENKNYPIVTSDQFDRLLKKSSVIKTFDLSEKTTIGKYIRQIRNDKNFPTSPLTARFDKNLMTTWNGIAYQNGVFASKGELLDSYWQKGTSMIGFDDYITGGFMRHGIICANLLNLEFLFEDKDTPYYDIPRYLGFYVNSINTGSIQVDGDLSFKRRASSGNTPAPVRKNKGYRNNSEDYYQSNDNGVKLYYMNETGTVPSSSTITGNQWMPRLWCVQNKDGHFISIDTDNTQWGLNNIGDDKYILLRDKSVNIGRFTGAGSVAFQSAGARLTSPGRSYCVFGLTESKIKPLDELRVYWTGGQKIDLNGFYDCIIANDLTGIVNGWGPGSYLTDDFGNTYFHPYGTIEQVLAAMSGALNSFEWRAFDAIVAVYENKELGSLKKEIVIRFSNPDDANNSAILQWTNLTNPEVVTVYQTALTALTYNNRFSFEGGTDSAKIRLRFPLDNMDELKNGEIWLKTRLGLSKVNFIGRYVDSVNYAPGTNNPNELIDFGKYGVLTIDNLLDDIIIGSTGDFMAYRLYNISVSLLSFYPIKEMDGDFLSSTYARTPTQEYRKYLNTTQLIVDREYLVFADDDTNHVIEYNGTNIIGTKTGTSFNTTTLGGTTFNIISGTPFICPAIFYRQAIPHDADMLLPGVTYKVFGDVGDVITYNSVNYNAGSTFTVPANPILGETLRWNIFSGNPVVIDTRNILDKDIASFSGFWTLHDIVSINSEVDTNSDKPSYIHRDRFFSNTVTSEYDNLKENYLKEYAVYSRTFPHTSKWVYKNGNDIRDNPYRLNTAQVFGQLNFSPSFRVKKQNPAGFTHEWYYLEIGPGLVETALENYYYFGEHLDYTELTNAGSTGYFMDYFTIQPGANQSVQNRYVDVTYNSETDIAECFFKGVKILFKEIQKDTQPDKLKGNKPPFISGSRRFDGYKFTSILRVIDEDKCTVQAPVTMTFAENVTDKTVTLVIDVVMDDYRVIQLDESIGKFNYDPINGTVPLCDSIIGASGNSILFNNDYPTNQQLSPVSSTLKRQLDYFTLYSMRDKKMEAMYPNGSFVNGADAAILGDVKLSTSMHFSTNTQYPSGIVGSGLGPLRRIYTFINDSYDYDMRQEINIIGRCCTMYGYQHHGYFWTPAPFTVGPNYVDFGLQSIPTLPYPLYADPASPGSYFHYEFMNRMTVSNIYQPLTVGSGSTNTWVDFPAWVTYGGTNYWEGIANKLSFGAIAELINTYSPLVRWKTYRWDGTTTVESDNEFFIELIEPSTIIKSTALVPQIDTDKPSELTSQSAIGVNLIEVPVISELQRYSGPYRPAFRDVITFYNQKIDEFNTNDLSFKRTTFDPNANGFGLSKNHGYLKVSDNNILSLANNTKYDSLYPLISETAIDYRDLNIFQSAWDPGFWRKFVTTQNYSPVAGTREMKEVKNYFGTKIMRTPNTVRVETFTTFGPVSGPEITTESINEEIFWYEKNGKVYVTINIGKRLARYFSEQGAGTSFNKYLLPEFGTGDPTVLDDDVITYLETNVVPAFDISLSDIYIKRYNQELNLPIVRGDINDTEKKQLGYAIEKNINTQRLKNLIYTFDVTAVPGSKISIAPSFTINRI